MIGLPYYCLYPPLLYDTNIPGDATESDASAFGLYVISMDSRFLMRVMS